jgi:hypothetical protein
MNTPDYKDKTSNNPATNWKAEKPPYPEKIPAKYCGTPKEYYLQEYL